MIIAATITFGVGVLIFCGLIIAGMAMVAKDLNNY